MTQWGNNRKAASTVLRLCARYLMINEVFGVQDEQPPDIQHILEILTTQLSKPINILKCHLYSLRSTAELTANKIYVLFKDKRKKSLAEAGSRLEGSNPLVAAALWTHAAQLYCKKTQYDDAIRVILLAVDVFDNAPPQPQELLIYKEMCANSLMELFKNTPDQKLSTWAAKIYLSLSYLSSESAPKALLCANTLMQLFDQNKEPSLLILTAQLYVQMPMTIALPTPAASCILSLLQLFNERKDPKSLELVIDLFAKVSRSGIPPSDILLQEAERCAISLLDLFNKNRGKTSFLHDAANLYTHILKNTTHRQGAENVALALLQLAEENIDTLDGTQQYESPLLDAARLYATLPLSRKTIPPVEKCIRLLEAAAVYSSTLSPESCAIEADCLTKHVAKETERLEKQEEQMALAAKEVISRIYEAVGGSPELIFARISTAITFHKREKGPCIHPGEGLQRVISPVH